MQMSFHQTRAPGLLFLRRPYSLALDGFLRLGQHSDTSPFRKFGIVQDIEDSPANVLTRVLGRFRRSHLDVVGELEEARLNIQWSRPHQRVREGSSRIPIELILLFHEGDRNVELDFRLGPLV